MMAQYFGYNIIVPDKMIEDYEDQFQTLTHEANEAEIYVLRDSIFTILSLIELAPDLLDESKYCNEFIKALAIREALLNIKILHNA